MLLLVYMLRFSIGFSVFLYGDFETLILVQNDLKKLFLKDEQLAESVHYFRVLLNFFLESGVFFIVV